MNLKRPCQLLVLTLFCISISCQREVNDQSANIKVNVQTIDTFQDFQIKEHLGLPARIKYDERTDHILAFDLAFQKILEINKDSEIICAYGKKGRGPGELQGVEDFYVRGDYLFIVDRSSFLINKYNRNGEFISALDYGELLLEKANNSFHPPPPALYDNYNEPYITIDGNVLLPAHTQGKSLYKLFDWEGKHLADLGEIPENYVPQIDKETIRETLAARKVPSVDLHKTFIVTDRSAPDEVFLIYGTIPKIAKYSISGEKIWERKIPVTPEVDSLTVDLAQITKN
ncbi:hypothetical protein LQ318_04875 [Aliifodinibius salicampi]|uniref:6-bladed beta-propeller protein n=1 Tax=Fodinibius salicampi TaxID=1920655 RepID=A0ABT3PWK9_9BACT|nr:hypothetical protein [Fodinibius salicampi]MCW9712235.1 hypothetical protein [Fodinibius salicampi]